MTAPFAEIRDLRRVFDVSKPLLNRIVEREPKRFLTAVAGVTFDIAKGETFALVGESRFRQVDRRPHGRRAPPADLR